MDDLNGLDWSSTTSSSSSKPAPPGTGNYYPSLRPTPPPQLQNSGRNTPLSAQGSGFKAPPKPFAPPKSVTPDSFSNLVSFGSSNKAGTLTLQQQQEKLQAEKRRADEEKRKQFDRQFGGGGSSWDSLGAGGSTSGNPTFTQLPKQPSALDGNRSGSGNGGGEEEDLFAAFNKEAPVDNSSYYPPPSKVSSGRSTPGFAPPKAKPLDLTSPIAWEESGNLGGLGDDDDPFGLGKMNPSSGPVPVTSPEDDDDFLGDLGKPVEEVRRRSPVREAVPESEPETEREDEDDPWDKAVAELVDMGFSAEQSRRALTESGSGLDIQAAVGWILNDAHRQAKQKQQGGRDTGRNGTIGEDRREDLSEGRRSPAWMQIDPSEGRQSPAWMQKDRDRSRNRRENNQSPGPESDLAKQAVSVGNNLFKTANSLWKTSQKKVAKAMNEFQQESDPGQPKWMREAADREQADAGREKKWQPETDVTDEALMLEGGGRPSPRKARAPEPRFSANSSRERSPAMPKPPPERCDRPERSSPAPRWQQTAPDPRMRLTKQAIEEQSAQAYVSPSRRKKAQPSPEPEVDLFSAPAPKSAPPKLPPSKPAPRASPASKPSTPIPTRPKATPRQIPPLSPTALANANQHRLAGTAHFKRGDYASAHASYTSSLSALPPSHPTTIILLCNRALTSLKTGVPKSAVSDSDTALALIGPSRGDAETIDLGPGEGNGPKDMREFYGKALMRKAEALEQMEQWKGAAEVWKLCVEHSVGGATAIQGRTRCEKALAPKPPSARRAPPRPQPRPSAIADLGSDDSAAVKRLREANASAERADDEKFALSDKVHERVGSWKNGKEDNLRALIGSLDNVMWAGSGWKKVGMHELVVNSKVKINYMKAIGKTHPDKLPQDASTEVKMIAALVFAALNEAWDKFKQQNGM
ncbi:uncharacterized protein L3040_002627 [Drepanopeziza brunnea f. sp. 'multigermtubi']|uniref:uncharacterized protein n=1 Tax=Drepanopeziza brunnea f. sp. 'multigermtubi' TaxID=698441 RepID=UPI002399BB5A|nr:hypothetical protein L3040_002627 [Drepanopeziza brunnea f. sp. 'multigermtubi']